MNNKVQLMSFFFFPERRDTTISDQEQQMERLLKQEFWQVCSVLIQ